MPQITSGSSARPTTPIICAHKPDGCKSIKRKRKSSFSQLIMTTFKNFMHIVSMQKASGSQSIFSTNSIFPSPARSTHLPDYATGLCRLFITRINPLARRSALTKTLKLFLLLLFWDFFPLNLKTLRGCLHIFS